MIPFWVTIITSSFSDTSLHATTHPLRAVVLISMTPMPPRRIREYSRGSVRLP